MKLKIAYQVRNWKQYNQALRDRGDITVWFTEEALSPAKRTAKRGRPEKYSPALIRLALSIRYFLHLPLRATQGFLDGILKMQGLSLGCCDYTLLSKRAHEVDAELKRLTRKISGPIHIVVDSTGLKVYGEGEWKTRVHGIGKRRTWKKLHLCVSSDTHKILGCILTDKEVHDGSVFSEATENIEKIGQCPLDGAYDQKRCYQSIMDREGIPIIPPRRGSNPNREVKDRYDSLRTMHVQAIEDIGRKSWKIGTGYHRRSLAETAMNRWKTIFSDKLKSRSFRNQRAEASIKADILNRLTQLGMPKTETIKKWVR